VFKDEQPEYCPPNMRMYTRVTHEELVKIIGACRVGLCTSRTESQHLAGIEMGACGLPMVAPPVGVYWERKHPSVYLVDNPTVQNYTAQIRKAIQADLGGIIDLYWKAEFSKEVIRKQWESLIAEVEG